MEAEEADLKKLKEQAEAVAKKIEAEKAQMTKKSDPPKVNVKELMDYSDKQLDKAEKTMEKKTAGE
jgi:hypothetical protein